LLPPYIICSTRRPALSPVQQKKREYRRRARIQAPRDPPGTPRQKPVTLLGGLPTPDDPEAGPSQPRFAGARRGAHPHSGVGEWRNAGEGREPYEDAGERGGPPTWDGGMDGAAHGESEEERGVEGERCVART
jgi:hypothetical protein